MAQPALRGFFDNQLNTYKFNVTAAKQELAQSAYPHGFSSVLNFSNADPDIVSGAQIVAQMLSNIGIKLTLRQLPDAQYADEVFAKRNAPGVTIGSPQLTASTRCCVRTI